MASDQNQNFCPPRSHHACVGISYPLCEPINDNQSRSGTFANASAPALPILSQNETHNENAGSNSTCYVVLNDILDNKSRLFPFIYICIVPLFWISSFIVGAFYKRFDPFWAWKLEKTDDGKAIFAGFIAIFSDTCGCLIMITAYLRYLQLNYQLQTSLAKITQERNRIQNYCLHYNRLQKDLSSLEKYNFCSIYFACFAGVTCILAGNFCFNRFYLYEIFSFSFYVSFFLYEIYQVIIMSFLKMEFQTGKRISVLSFFLVIFMFLLGLLFACILILIMGHNGHNSTTHFGIFAYNSWIQFSTCCIIWLIFIDTYIRMKNFAF